MELAGAEVTLLAIILGVTLAAAILGLIALTVYLRSSLAGERAALAALAIANRTQLLAERERDQAVVRCAEAETEARTANAALAATQRTANAERADTERRIKALLDSGTAADASKFLTDLLATPIKEP